MLLLAARQAHRAMDQKSASHHLIGNDVLVDGFKHDAPGISSFVLTHFHSDHYAGLHAAFPFGTRRVYCTKVTAALIDHVLSVPRNKIVALDFDVPVLLPCGTTLTLVPANHCPGSAMALFCYTPTAGVPRRVLHCGDARLAPIVSCNVSLEAARTAPGGIRELRLDTTYAHPKYTFPTQDESIAAAVSLVGQAAGLLPSLPDSAVSSSSAFARASTLIVVSSYLVGKERLYLALARAYNFRIFVTHEKMGILRCLDLPLDDFHRLTSLRECADVHVVSMGMFGSMFNVDHDALLRYLAAMNMLHAQSAAKDHPADDNIAVDEQALFSESAAPVLFVPQHQRYSRVIGILPTGWVDSLKEKRVVSANGLAEVFMVPYSEHSNFSELESFVAAMKPERVWPTVYSSDADRDRIAARFSKHLNQTAAKRTFLAAFGYGTQAMESITAAAASSSEAFASSSCQPRLQKRAQRSIRDWLSRESSGRSTAGEDVEATVIDDSDDDFCEECPSGSTSSA